MTSATADQASQQSSRRKLVKVLLATSPVWLILGVYFVVMQSTSSRLRRAIADADRLDPGWRFGDLERNRISPADEQNSALFVLQAAATLPASLSAASKNTTAAEDTAPEPLLHGRDLDRRLNELASPKRLPPEVLAGLEADLTDRLAACKLARRLADMGEGRYSIKYAPILYQTLLPQIQQARGVAQLLQRDAILRAETGDIDGALDSARAALGVARSIGDDPFAITQLVRMACETMAVRSFERALSQGEACDEALRRVQSAFALEERQPLLLYALRGERAGAFQTLDQMATGAISAKQFSAFTGTGPEGKAMALSLQFGAFGRYNQGLSLEMLNRAVEISKRPIPDQWPHWDKWLKDNRPSGKVSQFLGSLAYLLAPGGDNMAAAHQRTRALLILGQGVAACERYRLVHKHWPDRLDQLVPEFLAQPLIDPYDGKLVRLSRTDEGLLLYTVGPDRNDDGGRLDPRWNATAGHDLGLRLWNPDRRHQPLDEPNAAKDDAATQPRRAGP